MQVLLIKDVDNLGYAGDVKKFANGYGRNYLLPRGLAVLATPVGDLEELEHPGALRLLRPGEDGASAAEWLTGAAADNERPLVARRIAEAHLSLEDGVEGLAGVYRALGLEAGG